MTAIAMFRLLVTAFTLAAAFVTTIGVNSPLAQEAPSTAVVARVDGEDITETDLAIAAAEFRDQAGRSLVTSRAALIDLVINIRLAAKAAAAAEIDKDPLVAARVELAKNRVLYTEYLRGEFITEVTEEAGRKRFEEELAAFVPGEQVRVRHILVGTEDEAKAIIADLDAGADFAELAKEKSLDGSSAAGGDLSFQGRGDTVKSFEDAAFALDIGDYTGVPVETQFGWHVIKVDEKREQPRPAFEQEAQRIRELLFLEAFERAMDGLRSAVVIELVALPEDRPLEEVEAKPEAAEPAAD